MTKFEQDKIGRKEIVEKICWLVDNLQKDQHFCLALNGEWGSGKSFVLEYIAEELQKREEYIVVKYDAWKNSFYQDPLIAILYCVLDSVKEYFCYVDTAEKKFKRVAKYLKGSLQQFLDKAMGKAAENSDMEIKKIAIGYYAVKKVAGIIKEISENQILSHEKFSDFKSYQDLLKQAQTLLSEIANYQIYEKKQTKLIILVDEIDRCLPDEQLKILERLHHLFEVRNCAVVCALNKTSIEKTFKKIYDGEGNEYLRKFFDYNFFIKAESIKLLQYYLTVELFQKIRKVCKVESITGATDLEIIDNNIMDTSFVVLKKSIEKRSVKVDNRQVQNYYSALLQVFDEFGWGNLNSYYIYFIVLGLFVKKIVVWNFLEFDKYSNTAGQKLYARDYLNCGCNFNQYIEGYEYTRDFSDYNRTFDYICDQLVRNGKFSYNINNKPFKGDTKKLKQLMLTYGGQNETNER